MSGQFIHIVNSIKGTLNWLDQPSITGSLENLFEDLLNETKPEDKYHVHMVLL